VEKAQELLRDTELPLADIALACGFSSQSRLTTAFRRATGFTPARYRKGAAGGDGA
jgi:AraC family transcriptional regulator